jgi:hypothetical protein
MRAEFLRSYRNVAAKIRGWIDSQPQHLQPAYEQWALPVLARTDIPRNLSRDVQREVQRERKTATDAVMPYIPFIRTEMHKRFAILKRLYEQYCAAISEIKSGASLPFDFSSYEGEEELHFRIHSQQSFADSHPDVSAGKSNTLLLLFLGSSSYPNFRNKSDALWFLELFVHDVFGKRAGQVGNVHVKQAWLRSRGYEVILPFNSGHAGLMGWSRADGFWLTKAQKRAEGVFLPIDCLFALGTFGLLAADIVLCTSARINEVSQLRIDPDYFQTERRRSADGSSRHRHILKLAPKRSSSGKRDPDAPQRYIIGERTFSVIEIAVDLLDRHYGLGQNDPLPCVAYSKYSSKHYAMPEDPAPYLFQYHYENICQEGLNAGIRFLWHGHKFLDDAGTPVSITPHLLRHAAASYMRQQVKLSRAAVGAALKHDDAKMTDYYSAPSGNILDEELSHYLDELDAACGFNDGDEEEKGGGQ